MGKIIVLSGHGIWDPTAKIAAVCKLLGKKPFTNLPGKCSMHFYTANFTLLRDPSGQQLEKGNFNGVRPEQTAGPYKSVPNMILSWPRGLTVATPPKGWARVEYAVGAEGNDRTRIPTDSRNILFSIKEPADARREPVLDPHGRLYIDDLLTILDPAIRASQSTLLVWAACRQVLLAPAADKVKVRFMNESRIRQELDDDQITELYGKWNKFDPSIVPQVKRWVSQMASIDKETFYSILNVPAKLRTVNGPDERAKMERKWGKVWGSLLTFFVDQSQKWGIEQLNLAKRKDKLSFKDPL